MAEDPPSAEVVRRYTIHLHGRVSTADELRAQAMVENLARYGPLYGGLMGIFNTPAETDDKLDAQAQQLRRDTLTRSVPEAPGIHYEGMPHRQLYDAVNTGVDPGAVGAVAESWIKVGNRMAGFGDLVAKAIGSSESTWEGEAADKARWALAVLANKSGEAGRAAQLAGTVGNQQARALTTAKNSVPPPPDPPYDPLSAARHLQTITDPVAYAQQAQQDQQRAAAQDAAHKQAAQAVRTYDQTLTATASAAPAFAPPPSVVDPGGGGGPGGIGGPGGVGPRGGAGGPGGGIGEPAPVAPGSDSTGGPGSQGGPGRPGGGPVTPVVGGSAPDVGGAPGQTVSSGAGSVSAATGGVGLGPEVRDGAGRRPDGLSWGLGAGGPGPAGGAGLGGGSVRGGAGRGGFGGESGGFGGKSTGGGAGSGGPGTGARVGASHPGGPVGAGGSPTARGAGRPGAAGVGAGAGSGARGSGNDDLEHQRPDYLLEADPDGLFGTDEPTAPPVIGL
ncbi:hypothetical protein DFQ13_102277 [Actinokineospora spheciospongiae]|nr:hypothetical protein DFQ13_102277 [Actinokineospora spheciospongiae]